MAGFRALSFLVFLSAGFFCSSPSRASDIDCKAAKSDFDKIVCADPKLVELNKKIEKAFQEALAATPEKSKRSSVIVWQPSLESIQYEWRLQVVKMCETSPGKDVRIASEYCTRVFASRLATLKVPADISLGGIKFHRIDYYGAVPTVWANRNAGEIDIDYLQIVNPVGISQYAFNQYLYNLHRTTLFEHFLYLEGAQSADYEYLQRISFVGPGMISIVEDVDGYEHEAAHGWGAFYVSAWNVDAMRPVSFFDVFKRGVEAEYHFLDALYERRLVEFADEIVAEDEDPVVLRRNYRKWLRTKEGLIEQAKVHDLHSWSVLPEGLLLTYQDIDKIRSIRGDYHPCYFFSWKEFDGLVDMESIKRLTAGPIAYAPYPVLQSECHPSYKPK